MEKAGGVFFSLLMGGVLCFALIKIYGHKERQWTQAHPEHSIVVKLDEDKKPEPAKLPCRHS